MIKTKVCSNRGRSYSTSLCGEQINTNYGLLSQDFKNIKVLISHSSVSPSNISHTKTVENMDWQFNKFQFYEISDKMIVMIQNGRNKI